MTTVASRDPTTSTRSVDIERGAVHQFDGTAQLLRFVLRRDRLRLSLWLAGIVGLIVATAASITGLYNTQEELDSYAHLVHDNTALIVQAGPGYGLSTPTTGAVIMNEVEIWTIIPVALMSVFMIVRHTRAEEESERVELLRAAPVGRHAPTAAALLAVAVANVLIAVGAAASLVAYGQPILGSVAFGVTLIGAGSVFAAFGAVTAQIASTARSAIGLACVVIATSFVVRAIGDVGDGRLSWLSPIGWAQAIRAFADERWWVLGLPVAATAVLVTGAVELQSRRDLGGGFLTPRPGPATAGPSLASPLGLAVRLQRASIIGWTVGIGLVAFFYGIVADQADSILRDNPEMTDFFAQFGKASITDVFLSTSTLMLALVGTGFTISSALRLRSEESVGHAAWMLATPTTRRRWVTSHLTMTLVGTVMLTVVSGAALGSGFAAMAGQPGQIPRLVGSALVMLPAMFVMAGVVVLIYGMRPALVQASWGAFAFVCVVGLLGPVLHLPQWAMNVSPFQHVPPLPAGPFDVVPVIALTLVACTCAAIGLAAVDRRDID